MEEENSKPNDSGESGEEEKGVITVFDEEDERADSVQRDEGMAEEERERKFEESKADLKEGSGKEEGLSQHLVYTYYHEMASSLNDLIADILANTEKPIVIDEKLVLGNSKMLSELPHPSGRMEDLKRYIIKDVPGVWIHSGFVASNAYEAYRHAIAYLNTFKGAAIVLKRGEYIVLAKTRLPAKFVYAGRDAMII